MRVLLADDHPILVEGLRRVIDANDDLEVVATANDGDAAVAAALEHRARAMTKLGLHHRAEVVSFALGHGLMDPG